MIRRQRGMISVVKRKLITSDESFLTRAPMTPREVRRRYSKGLDFEVVLRKGYRKSGICAVHGLTQSQNMCSDWAYHSGRADGFHCERPHTVAEPRRCTLGWRQQQ